MRAWLRSVVNAILRRLRGKISRLDTATGMAMDSDFGDHSKSTPPERHCCSERDGAYLVKSAGPLMDIDLLEALIRVVKEAQERDAEDERRLYDPMLRNLRHFPVDGKYF